MYKAALSAIKGVGPGTINSIINGFNNFRDEIVMCTQNLNIINTNSHNLVRGPKVVLTGLRNAELINTINGLGFDCRDSYSVTKDTALLICDSYNSTSSKMEKAKKYGIEIISVDDFYKKYNL